MATTTTIIPATGTTVAGVTAPLRRGAAGRAVQKTPWTAAMEGKGTGAPLKDATATTPLPIATALLTALPTVLPTDHLAAPPTAHLTATGPLTVPATTPPPAATPTPQSPTAGRPPQTDRGARVMRSQTGMRQY